MTKNYANEHPKYKKKHEDKRIKVASVEQIEKNKILSNIILNELMSDKILEDLEKKNG